LSRTPATMPEAPLPSDGVNPGCHQDNEIYIYIYTYILVLHTTRVNPGCHQDNEIYIYIYTYILVLHTTSILYQPLPWRVVLECPMPRLYFTCIPPGAWYLTVSLVSRVSLYQFYISIHFAADRRSTVSRCIPLYPAVSSSYIYPAVSHRIPPPRKWDIANIAKHILQGRACIYLSIYIYYIYMVIFLY